MTITKVEDLLRHATVAADHMQAHARLFAQLHAMCERNASVDELAAVLLAAHQGDRKTAQDWIAACGQAMQMFMTTLSLSLDLEAVERAARKGVH